MLSQRTGSDECCDRHQRLKHAAACRSTCFGGLLVGVLKHAAACRSTLNIGLRFLGGGEYRTKISIPSLSGHLSEMASTPVVTWCICD